MKDRKELGKILKEFCPNIYFQPTTGTKMKYPCILYEVASGLTMPADNGPYLKHKNYNVTVIDKDPDSKIPDKVDDLPMCTFDRHFVSDNLHHFVYTIYF